MEKGIKSRGNITLEEGIIRYSQGITVKLDINKGIAAKLWDSRW